MPKFNFNFGNKKPTIFKYAIVGVVLSSTIALLSQCTHINESTIWDLLDETQRRYFPQTIINDFIIKDPEKLQRRIHRDINQAIENVTPEYDRIIEKYDRRYKPVYIEEPNNEETCYTKECKSLAPPMRICAPWYDGCPTKIETVTPPLTDQAN
jgi:hypothetical protein